MRTTSKGSPRLALLVVLSDLLLAAYLALHLWWRFFPLWGFILAAAAICLITVIVVVFAESRIFVFFQLLGFALLLRLIQPIATHFSTLPFGDPYAQLATLRVAVGQGRVELVSGGFGGIFGIYSGWPALNSLGMIASLVTGLQPLSVGIILPHILFAVAFVFGYKLFERVAGDLDLPSRSAGIAGLFLAVSPFAMVPPLFKYQDLALVLWGALQLLLYRNSDRFHTTGRHEFVILIFVAALVVTHHFTSLVALIFMAVLVVVPRLSSSMRGSPQAQYRSRLSALAGVGLIVLLVWWTYHSTNIWQPLALVLNRFSTILRTLSFSATAVPLGQAAPLIELTPGWLRVLLILRMTILLLLPVAGACVLFFYTANRPPYQPRLLAREFLLGSGAALGPFVVLDALFGPATLGLRVAYLAVNFSSFLAAFTVVSVINWRPRLARSISAALAVVSLTAMLGLWGLRYAPVHLYDPRMSLSQAGEHSMLWTPMQKFLEGHVLFGDHSGFLTDDVYLISLVIPWEQWSKTASIVDKRARIDATGLVVAFNGLNTTTYIAQVGDPIYLKEDFDVDGFRYLVNSTKDLVYDDRLQRIWR